MAYNAALNSLNGLLVEIGGAKGIFAGLPWFFQIWARDELLSLKGISLKTDVQAILERNLQHVQPDGTLLSRFPPSDVRAADAIGLLYLRKGNKEKLGEVLDALRKNSIKDGLFINHAKETWMDSIDRSGARIEMQALLLNMQRLFNRKKEEELKDAVRKAFWDGKLLADGERDWTTRPNVFLAAYYYPDLLSRDEWTTCFKSVLPELWNPWGGLASVGKSEAIFMGNSTGEDSRSYHNGDSWFFLNNLAALVMAKTHRQEFKRYIEKIVAASKEEILFMGAVGHHGEISSSSRLKSEGCAVQAWSAAFFIELVQYLTAL